MLGSPSAGWDAEILPHPDPVSRLRKCPLRTAAGSRPPMPPEALERRNGRARPREASTW